jgi:hypothetical protein
MYREKRDSVKLVNLEAGITVTRTFSGAVRKEYPKEELVEGLGDIIDNR